MTTKLAVVLAIDLFYVEYTRLLQYLSYLHTYKVLFSTADTSNWIPVKPKTMEYSIDNIPL